MPDDTYQPTDRRPIAARSLRVFQRIATLLVRTGVSANAISIAGMMAAIVAGVALWGTSRWPDAARGLFVLAAVCVQLRLIANMIDGMVAIESGKASRLGELYNEVPDRMSDMAVLIGAGYGASGAAELGYVAATLAVFVAYVRTLGKSAGAANEFCGPMAKQQRMFLVTVASLYLALTPQYWRPVIELAGREYGLMSMVLAVIIIGCVVTALRRLMRIVRALRGTT